MWFPVSLRLLYGVENKHWRSSVFWKKGKVMVFDAKSFVYLKKIVREAEFLKRRVVENYADDGGERGRVRHCAFQT
jgi:hypothetical protein